MPIWGSARKLSSAIGCVMWLGDHLAARFANANGYRIDILDRDADALVRSIQVFRAVHAIGVVGFVGLQKQ